MSGTTIETVAAAVMAAAPFYALATLLAAIGAVACYRQSRPAAMRSFADFIAFALPPRILFHRSARLDLWFMLVRFLARPLYAAPFAFSAVAAGAWLAGRSAFPSDASSSAPITPAVAVALVGALIVASDFARFFAHYLAHRVPLLWAFHKVHHSADVLIPPTALRLHPVDELCLFLALAVANTLVFAAFFCFFRIDVATAAQLGLDAYLVLYGLSFYPLRHSHLPLRFGATIERVLMSPAMHQLHHGSSARHHGKNLGLAFSLWDRVFGTFAAPEPEAGAAHPLGLGTGERGAYGTVWALYTTPFVELVQPSSDARRRLAIIERPIR
ncbi:MAG TPA: sterol desaturase family protein [Stellaceae bacterium]|nr:sterol desaturase family protein [Stellaceae bacterium]